MRELQQVREGACSSARTRRRARPAAAHRTFQPSIRRRASRCAASRRARSPRKLLERSVDFGVLTFQPPDKGLSRLVGSDELVMLARPDHPLAVKKRVTMEEVGRETVIAHNDPSPARERVLRVYERRHAPHQHPDSLPSLDGIKRAVEMGIGVAVLPRRCALSEIARGQLVAVKVPELGSPRSVRLVFRKAGECRGRAAAFLELARQRAEEAKRAEQKLEVKS